MKLHEPFICALVALAVIASVSVSSSEETNFVAEPLTEGEFTDGIEGPACDRDGNIYCVSFRHARNIARVSPEGRAELFVELPEKSAGNGIRFDRHGLMYVADYKRAMS